MQGARRIAYLKFDLSALPAPVSQATLVLSVTRGGPDGGMVSRVADRGVQVHGGLGYMSSTVVERMYRDSRLYRLYEGTSEIQKLIIARALLSSATR